MKLFLTGSPGSGKSTVLMKVLELLKRKNLKVGGIVSPEVRKNGERIGFEVVDIFSGKRKIFASICFKTPYSVGKYFVDINVFEEIAINALEFALKECDVVAIDEIGKMELLSEKFKEIVYAVINSEKPLIAVVHRNYAKEFGKFGKLIVVTKENRENLPAVIFAQMVQIFDKKG